MSRNSILLPIILFVAISFNCSSTSSIYDASIQYTINSSSKNTEKYFNETIKAIQDNSENLFTVVTSQWKIEAPEDPELFFCNFLYYLNKSIIHNTVKSDVPPQNGIPYSEIYDEEKDCILYEYNTFYYDRDILNIATEFLENGLKLHPNRLDLWLELISTFLNDSQWKNAEQYLYMFIDQAKLNQNNWLSGMNKSPYAGLTKSERTLEFRNTINQFISYLTLQTSPEARNVGNKIATYLEKRF